MNEIVFEILANGDGRCIYTDEIDLGSLGRLEMTKAGRIEWDMEIQEWTIRWPDGSSIGGFRARAEAVREEHRLAQEDLAGGVLVQVGRGQHAEQA